MKKKIKNADIIIKHPDHGIVRFTEKELTNRKREVLKFLLKPIIVEIHGKMFSCDDNRVLILDYNELNDKK